MSTFLATTDYVLLVFFVHSTGRIVIYNGSQLAFGIILATLCKAKLVEYRVIEKPKLSGLYPALITFMQMGRSLEGCWAQPKKLASLYASPFYGEMMSSLKSTDTGLCAHQTSYPLLVCFYAIRLEHHSGASLHVSEASL